MLARRSSGTAVRRSGRRSLLAVCSAVAIAGLLRGGLVEARDGFIVQDRRTPIDYTAEI
jgi:hypothetical protein